MKISTCPYCQCALEICRCSPADITGRRARVVPAPRLPAPAPAALTDPITERRLMASLIAEPHVLAMADDLEDQDFSDPRCRHVLRAIRRLRVDGADVELDEIDHELRLQDMEREQVGAGAIADKAGFWFVAELLLEFTPYQHERVLVEHDMTWLRELADRRRNLPTDNRSR